ncbi:MAG: ParB N-terminal domain-containing protein [Planctomycetota bacterium]|nr:ParB N-terminal domain-containing protein [Planctomycetota bacterium]
MTANDPVPQGDDVYRPEQVTTKLEYIPLNLIDDDPENFAFRDDDELTDAAINDLAEDIAVNGLTTPLLVAKRANDRYLVDDGHRRLRALRLNAKQGVVGFNEKMLVAANVIAEGASELALVARAVAANVQHRPLSADGRRRAVIRLKQLGMPNDEIARCAGVSKQTVERDLALASSGCMWDHVRDHNIPLRYATFLVKLAKDAKDKNDKIVDRTDDLCAAMAGFVDEQKAEIEAEQKQRKEADEDPMSLSETWPSRYFTAELAASWKMALEKGLPLTRPSFRYRADVKEENGVHHILIDSVKMSAAKMSARDLAKVLERLVTCAAKIKPILKEKEQAEAARQTAQATASDAGRKVLEELGLTDGILMMRYLFDPNGTWGVSDALGFGATRTTKNAVKAALDQYRPVAPSAQGEAEASSPRSMPAEAESTARQLISATPQNAVAALQGTTTIDVNHTTDPADSTLTGLGLRLHYNSSALTFKNFSNVFSTALLSQQLPADDTVDYDNDPATDKYVMLGWADLAGNWPGALPKRLCSANFEVNSNAITASRINFTASSIAAGWLFDSLPATIRMDSDIDGVPDTEEAAAPHGGDGNSDGVPDSQQPNVSSFLSRVNGKYVTLAAAGDCPARSVIGQAVAASRYPAASSARPGVWACRSHNWL